MSFDAAYRRITGREPDAEAVKHYERIAASLDDTDSDALLTVFIALDYHKSLYSDIPRQINQASTKTLKDFEASANAIAEAAMEQSKADMSAVIGRLANDVARDVSGRQKAKWIAFATVTVTAAILTACWFGYAKGEDGTFARAFAAGQASVRGEHALANWGNTPQGRQAYRLAQGGSLDNLLNCNLPGWSIDEDKNVCVVRPANGSIYGWSLPPQGK